MMAQVNVPTVLEQRLLGTPISYETTLSRRELATLFYVGRKLELIASYCGTTNQPRTIKAHKSYGYVLARPEGGADSYLRFEKGNIIRGVSAGNGFYEVKIVDEDGVLAAHYRLP